MEYFLRFTDDEQGDLDRAHSFFKNSDEKLPGLCGFRIAYTTGEFETLNIEQVVQRYQRNFGYISCPVIFSGNMISRGPVEGDLFEPINIV